MSARSIPDEDLNRDALRDDVVALCDRFFTSNMSADVFFSSLRKKLEGAGYPLNDWPAPGVGADIAHKWIRPALGLTDDAPRRFDYYAMEIEKLKAVLAPRDRAEYVEVLDLAVRLSQKLSATLSQAFVASGRRPVASLSRPPVDERSAFEQACRDAGWHPVRADDPYQFYTDSKFDQWYEGWKLARRIVPPHAP